MSELPRSGGPQPCILSGVTASSANDFDGFRALSFDCYGTLIDWESGLAAELTVWAAEHGIAAGADELLVAFAAHESDVQQQQPRSLYPAVLATTLRRL